MVTISFARGDFIAQPLRSSIHALQERTVHLERYSRTVSPGGYKIPGVMR